LKRIKNLFEEIIPLQCTTGLGFSLISFGMVFHFKAYASVFDLYTDQRKQLNRHIKEGYGKERTTKDIL
jgi:hypothetical protein